MMRVCYLTDLIVPQYIMTSSSWKRTVVQYTEESHVVSHKRALSDESESDSSQSEGQVESEDEPPVEPPNKRRRASIFPGSTAYNDAILASFDAVLLEDLARPNADSHSESDTESEKSSSEDNVKTKNSSS